MHAHVFHFLREQRLGCHHVLNFTRSDTEGNCCASSVGARVRVTANDSHAGKRCTLFRSHNVDDALSAGQEREKRRTSVLTNVFIQCRDLQLGDRISNALHSGFPTGRRCVVIGCGHNRALAPQRTVVHAQSLKSLGTGHFVDQMTVDVEGCSAVFFHSDDVFVKDFVVECFRGFRCSHFLLVSLNF